MAEKRQHHGELQTGREQVVPGPLDNVEIEI